MVIIIIVRMMKMQIETEIEVKFKTTLGDSFDDGENEQTIKDLIEQHIQDFADEHNIDRNDIKVVK